MSLCETGQRMLKQFIEEREKHDTKSREFLIAYCREQSLRQVLQVLNLEPIDKEIFWCRNEIRRLALEKDYVSENHIFLIKDFDKGEKLLT